MSQTIDAVFDGEVLRPEQPLELQPNTRVRVTVDTLAVDEQKSRSFLRTARSLKLQEPRDWSERIEEYLHEEPTHGKNGSLP